LDDVALAEMLCGEEAHISPLEGFAEEFTEAKRSGFF
jgi:hypothetical protein